MKKIVRIVSILGVILFGVLIMINLYQRNQTDLRYKKLEKQYTSPIKNSGAVTVENQGGEKSTTLPDWYQKYGIVVDFTDLQEINQDIIGWVDFDSLDISYPILLGRQNEDYLRTDFYGNSATAGSIFMDSMNHKDFGDYHTIIYGHNMRNGSMFGQLKNYKNEVFYSGNDYFTIYTSQAALRYQIFSCHDTDAYGTVYTVGFMPDDQFETFLNGLLQASWYDYGVNVTKDDHIVTLSTCTSKNENRFVIHAKLVDLVSLEE